MKVLFVDDDLITAEWIQVFLNGNGIFTKTAASITDAIECLREWLPDVIISDIRLETRHTFVLLDHLESSARTTNIPVIALTGYPLNSVEQQRFRAYLTKPVEPQLLLQMIRDLRAVS